MLIKQTRKAPSYINLKGLWPDLLQKVRVSLWVYHVTERCCIYISLCWLSSSNDGLVFEQGNTVPMENWIGLSVH